MSSKADETTRLLDALRSGDATAAEKLFPLLYGRLHNLARRQMQRERRDHTLQPTALLHEAYLEITRESSTLPAFSDEAHFLAVAALTMRRILVDHATARHAQKRGGDRQRLLLEDVADRAAARAIDILALNEALERLADLDARQAQLVELRFFGGLSVAQCADILGISQRSAHYEWAHARAWLRSQLQEDRP